MNTARLAPALCLGLMLALSVPDGSSAQPVPPSPGFEPLERPGEIRPELPAPAAPKQPSFVLPPLPPPVEDEQRLSRGPEVVVREFRVTGSSVFSAAELAALTGPYLGRPIGGEQLHELRDRITRLYVDAGYLNSGAVLPDQDVREGVVEYRIVEGRLSEILVEGNRWYRSSYLVSRMRRGAHTPLAVRELENELQLLQQDPRIRRVDAELLPGERPGEARLRTRFEEELPYFASLEYSNHESPSVGSYRTQLDTGHRNLVGRGDTLRLMVATSEGLEEYEIGYEIPITSYDTTLGAWLSYGSSGVVEEPFEDLEVASRSKTVGIELRQPIHRTLESQLDLALTGEWRKSQNRILDNTFYSEGTDDGHAVVTVVRFRQDYLYRDLRQVVAARSQLSVGLDALGATMHGCVIVDPAEGCFVRDPMDPDPPKLDRDGIADAQFLTWLGQFQWVRRFEPWGWETVLRTDVQLSNRPLFSLEQFSLGGHQSVRGYRENELVRDNGFASSLELRIPLWSNAAETSSLQLAPFFDIGRSWNTERDEASPRTLAGVGVGLRAAFTRHLRGELYWGHPLHDVPEPEERDLQDDGVHFSLVASF